MRGEGSLLAMEGEGPGGRPDPLPPASCMLFIYGAAADEGSVGHME